MAAYPYAAGLGACAGARPGRRCLGRNTGRLGPARQGRPLADTYTKANTHGGLPHDWVRALSPGQDGALWVGTGGGGFRTQGGLARLDKDGHWQTYTKANTNGGLPDDTVLAL